VINFSHRIDRFSFSEEPRGGMSLDGDVNKAETGMLIRGVGNVGDLT
jgi:hypothetical protein